MNSVEIDQAISELVEQPFDAQEFSYAFLEAFGNNTTKIKDGSITTFKYDHNSATLLKERGE